MKILTINNRRRLLFGLILTGLLQLAAGPLAAAESHAVVFMYHRFGETKYPSTNVTLAQFESQLDYLAENGFRIWPLERIVDHLRENRPIPDRTAAITVDDAYRSVYEQAYPRLKARGWPFTVFVATDPVDQGIPGYMTWQQMREMQQHGARFANHSASHDHLVVRLPDEEEREWRARVAADISRAEQRLREELGSETGAQPMLFAYPYGEFDLPLMALLEGLGYIAFGQHSGPLGGHTPPQGLPRYPVSEAYADPDDFALKAATLPLPVVQAEPQSPWVGEVNPPRLKLTLEAGAYRTAEITCYAPGQGSLPITRLTEGPLRIAIDGKQPLPAGRSRYNCTAPAAEENRWYWYSHPWLIPPLGEEEA